MINSNSNFQKIEVQGAIGDRKCDGYIKGEGIFYQVYGPKGYNLSDTTQKSAINKFEEDLTGLLKHIESGYWEELKEYVFVIKSHRGYFPDLIEKVKDLESKFPEIKLTIYDIDSLMSVFSQLADSKISMVANTFIPNPDFDSVNYKIIGDIIKHLTVNGHSDNLDITKDPPNFSAKINFNGICNFYGSNLNIASYSLPQLDDYLSSYGDTEISDYLCSIFKELYESAKIIYPTDSNLQFKHILENCRSSNTHKDEIKVYESNSYIIMAKYFETCDIFEEPK